ncbi:MAG: hypothetical protein NC302_04130 [Bacteroidales bacterium]|nr:hypothetical protein [Bacteroidales bacterium]MCM1414800.1 hypothetical protein [bacterium]MCM1422431.1 hypothetical protein [bacterium]
MPERLTWEQMVQKYPDKWLALSDCEYYDSSETTIIKAAVYKVFDSDDEYEDFRIDNMGKGYRYRYTTEPVISGVTYGENFAVGIR